MKLLIPVCAGLALALTSGCTPTYLITEPIDAQMMHTVGPQAFSRQFPPPRVTCVQVFAESLSAEGDSIWFTGVNSSLYEARWGVWVERSGLQLRPGDSVEVEVSGRFLDPVVGQFRGSLKGPFILPMQEMGRHCPRRVSGSCDQVNVSGRERIFGRSFSVPLRRRC